MNFLTKALKAVSLVLPVAISTANPAAVINVVGGAVLKHVVRKLPNDSIPMINFAASTGMALARGADITVAVTEGAMLAGASTAIHQTTKIPVRSLTGKSV